MAFRPQRSMLLGARARRKFSIDEEVIEIDSKKGAGANIKDMLIHLARHNSLNKARVLAYLNGLVRYYTDLTSHHKDVEYPEWLIILCLRGCTLNKHSIVRAAAFRCLRYFLDTTAKVDMFFQLKMDWCLARSLDLHLSHDTERSQAIRLCRHLIQTTPLAMCPSLIRPFIALAADAVKSDERMVLLSLELLCELAYGNPELLASCGGVQVILQYIIHCHNNPRVNEALLQTVLYLLNTSQTRASCSPHSGLDQLLAPFTDSLYKHGREMNNPAESNEDKAAKFQEERLLRCQACAQALLSALHTWPGLINLASPQNTALSSLVNALQMSAHPTQKILLHLIYDIFLLRVPKETEDFEQALINCDPCTPSDSWGLREGFVAAECLALHKETSSRPNLVDNHLALLLSTFIAYGLMEALCEVVIHSNGTNSIWATILLGELLHMSFLLLPWGDSDQTHFLPTLVAASHSLTYSRRECSQAHQAVEYLDRLHSLKKRGRLASSLHLELLISFIPESEVVSIRNQKYKSTKEKLEPHLPQDTDESVLQLIRDSLVLIEANPLRWRWRVIKSILQCNTFTLKRVEDYSLHRFLSKLLHFYNPGAEIGFCTMKLSDPRARVYTSIGLVLLDKILQLKADESHRHLCSLLVDICHSLSEIRQEVPTPDAKLGLNYIYTHCCQNYFLFIGKLSQSDEGLLLLESTGIMQLLLDLVTITSHEAYVKLTVSSLDYTKDGMCRIILSKALTATSENARLYTADFMRALLRLGVPFFSNWCMDLLITQLYDQSKNVSMRSLSVINEACEDPNNLRSLVNVKPSVLHLGALGSLLVTRHLSIQEGFGFLKETNYIQAELQRWREEMNIEYTEVVDELLADSLTSYEKSFDDEVQRRSNATRQLGKSVYVPPHLYGQLIQHNEGAEIVANLPYLTEFFDVVRTQRLMQEVDVKQSKAAIWAVGHIGSSVFGLGILDKQGIIPSLIDIAEKSPVLTLRGTAYYALGLVASTQAGVHRLAEHGWRAVMNHRSEEWPVVSSHMLISDPDAVREIRSFSAGSSMSHSSGRSDFTDPDSSKGDTDEGARSRTSTDELIDKLKKDVNEEMYKQTTSADHFTSAVMSGKAHSTSELSKTIRGSPSHRRCSSDLCTNWDQELPAIVIEDEHFSMEPPLSSLPNGEDVGSHSPNINQSTPAKRISHKISKSLVEMGSESSPPVIGPSRSLSWRSDVRETGSMSNLLDAGEMSQPMNSMDSAISQTSISPIDTGKSSTALTDQHTMSLNREKKGKNIGRKTRFSSLQSQLTKYDSLPRSLYITQKDEVGQAAIREMRRNASTASSDSRSSLSARSTSSKVSRRAHSGKKMILNLSMQGDLDALSEARKFSDLGQQQLSSAVKYMGLALPVDVINMYELGDMLTKSYDVPIANDDQESHGYSGVEGLHLHTVTNCLECVSVYSDSTQVNGNCSQVESCHLTSSPTQSGVKVDSLTGRTLLRKECVRFITTICSSIGVHAAEEGLLRLREQFPDLFNDLCLYSEVCSILSHYQFHLPARRFIQELFQEPCFELLYNGVKERLEVDEKVACCDKHQSEFTTTTPT